MNNNLLGKIPDELAIMIGRREWQEVMIGCSGAQTFYLTASSEPGYYLKIISCNSANPLYPEKARLDWLQSRLPVPQMLYYKQDETREYLLMSELPGLMSCDASLDQDLPCLVRMLANSLKLVHSLNIATCPFDQRLHVKLPEAYRRIETGYVDESDFDDEHLGQTAQRLYQKLLATRPKDEDLVFTHGDFCLPNIIVTPTYILSGFTDWGRAGIADRYQDLALCARSLNFNFGSEWPPLLFEAYGLDKLEQAKLEFYCLLDEFF